MVNAAPVGYHRPPDRRRILEKPCRGARIRETEGQPMLQLTQIAKHFGARRVIDDLSLIVQGRDRIGLVGVNGSGKSTLLKIMAGLIPPDGGTVSLGRGETAGYLPQDGLEAEGRPLLEEVLAGCHEVRAIENEIRELEAKLETSPASDPAHDAMLERYGHLQGEFQRQRYELNAALAELFSRYDLVLTPTMPTEAFGATGPLPSGVGTRPFASPLHFVAFTFPLNLSGHPAATVRAGFTDAGLPRYFTSPLPCTFASRLSLA